MKSYLKSVRAQLIGQHLTEYIIVTSLAMGIAFALTYLSIPFLNNAYQRFVQLIVIAFFLASIMAYFVMKQWLLDFQYRIEMPIAVFIITGIASILIAVFTVSLQGMRAAMANPAESLRSE